MMTKMKILEHREACEAQGEVGGEDGHLPEWQRDCEEGDS